MTSATEPRVETTRVPPLASWRGLLLAFAVAACATGVVGVVSAVILLLDPTTQAMVMVSGRPEYLGEICALGGVTSLAAGLLSGWASRADRADR